MCEKGLVVGIFSEKDISKELNFILYRLFHITNSLHVEILFLAHIFLIRNFPKINY